MQETAQGIRIVKAFNLEPIMRERMHAAIEAVRQRADKIDSISARTGPLMEMLGGFAIAGVMLWAGYAAIYYDQKPGAFMSFITAILLAYEPAKRLASTRVQIEQGLVGVRPMYKMLDTKPTMEANPDGPDLEAKAGEVVFEKVTFAYPRAKPVFRGLDLRLLPGKVTALVGPSGAGKSTIINLIERYYDVGAGRDHHRRPGHRQGPPRLAPRPDRAGQPGCHPLPGDDPRQHPLRPPGRHRRRDRGGRAQRHGPRFHHGDQGRLRHRSSTTAARPLSGGQRQRIAIARAMLRECPHHSPRRSHLLARHRIGASGADRLRAADQGRTTIVIAHRLSTVLDADQICVLVDGKIVEEGRHAELIAASNHYARLYHLQFEKHGQTTAGPANGGASEPAVAAVG